MDWNFIFFFNSVLFGVGLAMDAFSVSLAAGLDEPDMTLRRKCAIAGTFAGFQIAMPLIGWLCVHTIATIFTSFQKFIPWIALILLLFIGGRMLAEGMKGGDVSEGKPPMSLWSLLVMGVATSIDALSVGFTIAELPASMAVVEALIIGAVTFGICIAGLELGRRLGMKLAGRASILGGCILIAIGLEIFLSGVLLG